MSNLLALTLLERHMGEPPRDGYDRAIENPTSEAVVSLLDLAASMVCELSEHAGMTPTQYVTLARLRIKRAA